MAFVKKNPEVQAKQLASLQKRRESLQNDLKDYHEIANGKDSEFWQAIKKFIFSKINSIENDLTNYEKIERHDMLIATLEARKNFNFFTDLPEIAESSIILLNKEIEKIDKELNGIS